MKINLKKPSQTTLLIAVSVILILTVSSSVYLYIQYSKSKRKADNPQAAAAEEIKIITDKVGKLIIIPTDETPTVATISNAEKLKDRAFFANAKNGDKLIIYPNAKKAILYDPSANKIIDVGPVSLPTAAQAETTSSAKPQDVKEEEKTKVYMYNGTSVTGATLTFERKYKDKLTFVEFVDRDNASKKDYEKTLVIDLTGSKSDIATRIAEATGAETATLPAGENKPEGADILIIIGKK